MEDLALSVVIPTHNRARLIGRALASVLSEIGKDDEIVVIDDGSTDRTEQVIAGFEDGRIRYIRQAKAGAGVARNRGVREARGGLIAFLDSDDEWLPGKVELQRRFMAARPDVLFSFTDFARDFGGQRHPRTMECWQNDVNGWREAMGSPVKYSSVAEVPEGMPDVDVYYGDIYRVEMHASYLSAICMMVRRDQAGDEIRFAEGVDTYEDWECFGRLARRGRLAHLDYVGALQHAHSEPRVTDADWASRAQSRLTILKNVWGSDADFLGAFGDEYRAVVHEQRLAKIRGLLVLGRMLEARRAMADAERVPVRYRFLAWMPGWIMTCMVDIAHAIREIKGKTRETAQGKENLA